MTDKAKQKPGDQKAGKPWLRFHMLRRGEYFRYHGRLTQKVDDHFGQQLYHAAIYAPMIPAATKIESMRVAHHLPMMQKPEVAA